MKNRISSLWESYKITLRIADEKKAELNKSFLAFIISYIFQGISYALFYPLLNVIFSPSFVLDDAIKNKKVKFDSNICWNGDMCEGHRANSIYEKNKQAIFHNISIDNELFKELSSSSENIGKTKTVYKSDYIDVHFNNYINTKQKLLLDDLTKISLLDDKLQMLYLESKLLDLIYTTFKSIETEDQNENIYLNTKDIECLYKAKTLLLNNMTNPPSLKELAYKSAINEFKLKKGFKQLFGNTVYGLLQEYRLNEAKKLLESNEINISEASSLVGYKSISHFSKIFKNHFGITPIQIKKETRTIYY
jgi:AraC-like DNA-binding protein